MVFCNLRDGFLARIHGALVGEVTRLFCADYSAIEARVLFWLAGHTAGIEAYRAGRPIYEEMAARIYAKPVSAVTKSERELGKRVVLGCGYNMGWKKFQETCATFGDFVVTEALAKMAVSAYRELHWPVPVFWAQTQRSAILAVRARTKISDKNANSAKAWWFVDGQFLWCELLSGRRLAYYKPEIRQVQTPWFEMRPALYHWGSNPLSHQWECSGTYGGKLVENITQAVARDLMAEAMLRVEAAGYRVVLSVHDELLAENERGSVEEFEKIMGELPYWAAGLPVKVAGWCGERYKK